MNDGPSSLAEDFAAELKAQGLPPTATLADLIRHHQGNAGITAVMKGVGEGTLVFSSGDKKV